jgi:hypothetical protein
MESLNSVIPRVELLPLVKDRVFLFLMRATIVYIDVRSEASFLPVYLA